MRKGKNNIRRIEIKIGVFIEKAEIKISVFYEQQDELPDLNSRSKKVCVRCLKTKFIVSTVQCKENYT